MKKLVASSLIVALAFTLTGCTLLKPKQEQKQQQKTEQKTQQEEKKETKSEDNKNVFTSIKDAVSKQIGLKCEYEDTEGVKATTYIKGTNVYLESEIDNDGEKVKFKGIMKDQKYYLWGDGSNQGMVFDLSKLSSGESQTNGTKVQTQDEIIAKLEQNKNRCQPENISASKFDTPSDVNFVEWNMGK
ncbi:hypothetical protein GYA27_02750 [candidate division WWE3 bacterium]|uniref:DUF4412 domain-containing protein n=1 Tax=candidate division WWE3 bacterium TaxID=2053526 RepID=A0A7X9DKI7_UNCKA|nr:hypothetical protein [candidate division WWE3 bacterium]